MKKAIVSSEKILASLLVFLFQLALINQSLLQAQLVKDPIHSISVTTIYKGRDSGITWFLPRVCPINNQKTNTAFMTMQAITGSDYYGPVHYVQSIDNGLSWSQPQLVPGLGRRPVDDDMEEAVSDVISQYHNKTKTLISIGEILYYKKGKFFKEQPPRFPVYLIRDRTNHWSQRKKLEWEDARNTAIYGSGSSQFVILPNGDLLIPVTFRSKEKKDCSVSTLLCSYDGTTIKVKKVGVELMHSVNRGLLEPQLIIFQGLFYLTIRAEDGKGYVSTSKDGLNWSAIKSWSWENGVELAMSTTQQHWMKHGQDLYLVYTRKTKENVNVLRWRSPLFMAKVDPVKLNIIQSSERVVFPLIGDGINDPKQVPQYGNFHVANLNEKETWITSGEVIQANYKGDLLMARIIWKVADTHFQ